MVGFGYHCGNTMTDHRKSLTRAETLAVLERLRSMIRGSDRSLRGLCAQTAHLPAPERLYHSTLSNDLRGVPRYNLYLQQFLLLLRLLGTSPLAFFAGSEAGGWLAAAYHELGPSDRRRLLAEAAKMLDQQGSERLARRLRRL